MNTHPTESTTEQSPWKSIKQQGRLAGLLWLLSLVTFAFGLIYIRSNVLVPGDAQATVANITASEFLFRAAIVSGLFSHVFLLFAGLTLFHLFKKAHKRLATVLLTSLILITAIAVVNVLNFFGALVASNPPAYLKVFTPEQLAAVAMFFLRMGNSFGQGLLEIFWTPYYFTLGLLVIKSRYLPKILGILLMLMSAGYAVNILNKFLVPYFYPALIFNVTVSLSTVGVLSTIFWLLIFGAKERPSTSSRL